MARYRGLLTGSERRCADDDAAVGAFDYGVSRDEYRCYSWWICRWLNDCSYAGRKSISAAVHDSGRWAR